MASNLLELMRVINDVIRLLGSPSFPSLPGDFTFQPTERQIDTSRILCRLCGAHLLMDQTPESAQHQILRKKSTKGIRFCGEMGSMGDEPGWNVELGGGQYKSRSLSLSLFLLSCMYTWTFHFSTRPLATFCPRHGSVSCSLLHIDTVCASPTSGQWSGWSVPRCNAHSPLDA